MRHSPNDAIAAGLGENAVLQGRIPTGEIYSQNLAQQQPERDWILTRILWLDGLEAHNQNTKSRFIYIHGAPDEASFAAPSSKGCIRMRNADIMALFDLVAVGEIVQISDEKPAAKAY
ncbi:MAG: L,D-transpeptidase [Candidatus Thioglobus sp.]|nr:L,D-transpeptidase [Candidatus Thioglobus sp.]